VKTNILTVILSMFLSGATIAGQTFPDTLQGLIETAIKVNPKIKMLQSKFDVAGSKIKIGTSLPDPVLTLGLLNIPVNTFSFTQEPMTGKAIGISQGIPFPGSLKAAAEVKAVDTLIVRQEINDLKNQIKKQVSDLYFDLQEQRVEIVLADESMNLLKQISNVARRKYEVGTASLQNIVQVEVQITRVSDKIESLKGKEKSILSQLNAFLLRNDTTPIITTNILPIESRNIQTDSLLKLAEMNRPLLKEIKLYEHKAVLQQKAARYAFYPNFKVGVLYSQRSYNRATGINYPDFTGIQIGITIPVNYGGNKTAQINESRYLQELYNNQFNASLQILQQSFGNTNARLSELESREKIMTGTLLPQAEQAYKAAIADYQVNKIDFANVITAEDNILKIKTELAKIRTEYYKYIAQLEFLSGVNMIQN
jgi:outer membrane protein, heavy metal efflux system